VVTTEVTANQAKVVIAGMVKSLSAEALETFFDVGGQRELLKEGGDFGLGAALASRIILLFRGQVAARNAPGLVIEVTLPIIAP
jgi:signal transduction histidine kinase